MSPAPARACGIDFGTSNSTVGWLRPGAQTLLILEDDKPTLPSAVFFNADEESTHFGRDALAEYLEGYEGRLMRALKSLLGSKLMEGSTEVGGRALPFKDLLASFIGELKRRAETQAGRGFEQAVFGRPVFFVDGDPSADQRAEDTLAAIARQVGFKEVSFQFEPIGAARHYEAGLDREELVLIADIGGGTADFSLVRLSPERARHVDRKDDLLGNAGLHVGGTDFDRALSLECVMPLLGYRGLMKSGAEVPSGLFFQLATWHTINFAYTRQAFADFQQIYRDAAARRELDRLARLIGQREGHWLALQVEQAKIDLSTATITRLHLDRQGSRVAARPEGRRRGQVRRQDVPHRRHHRRRTRPVGRRLHSWPRRDHRPRRPARNAADSAGQPLRKQISRPPARQRQSRSRGQSTHRRIP